MSRLGALVNVYRAGGIAGVVRTVASKVSRPRVRLHGRVLECVSGKYGLEIGGPSSVFSPSGLCPVYDSARLIDHSNYASETVWSGQADRSDVSAEPGFRRFICEATNLAAIPDHTYDFVLSSHCLEHIANPLLALHEWRRVLKRRGSLILVLPHRDGTFDHRRPVTPLRHMIEDFENSVDEHDLTHLPEILRLHDTRLDPGLKDVAELEQRGRANFLNRCLHHHVFDTRSSIELLFHGGWHVEAVEARHPNHIFLLAQAEGDSRPDLEARIAEAQSISPFSSDSPGRRTS